MKTLGRTYNVFMVHGCSYGTGPNGKGLYRYLPDEGRWQCVAPAYEFCLDGVKCIKRKIRRYVLLHLEGEDA